MATVVAGAAAATAATAFGYYFAGDMLTEYVIPLLEGAVGVGIGITGLVMATDTNSTIKPYVGLGLGGAGIFLTYDAVKRWGSDDRSISDTWSEAYRAGEMTLGGILGFKGAMSLLNVSSEYSGTYKMVDTIVGIGGLVAGAYLLYDGYVHFGGWRDITSTTTEVEIKNFTGGDSFKVNRIDYFSDYKNSSGVTRMLTDKDGNKYEYKSALTDQETKVQCLKDGNSWIDPPKDKVGLVRGCYNSSDAGLVKEYNRGAKRLSDVKAEDISDMDRDALFALGDKKTCQQWVNMLGYNGEDGLRLGFALPNECRKAVAAGSDLNFVPKPPLFS